MKFLYDFFPILLFFIAYKLYGIYVATAVVIISSFVQVGFSWFKNQHIENMHIATLILVTVLGGATLLLHDETFIKWKPTIVNWLFAVVFLGSQFLSKKTLIQRMMESNFTLNAQHIWIRLNIIWVIFFTVMGILNLYVAFSFDTDTWVNFKLFGMMGLTFIFVLGQGLYLSRYIVVEEDEK
jgi:intracellular septation protein